MSNEFDTKKIIEAVRNFEKLAIEEFNRLCVYEDLTGYAPNYFDGPYESVIEKIEKDFPISSEPTADGLLKNVTNFTYKVSKAILDGNWREEITYSFIMILLKFQLANLPQYQGYLYWKSSMVLAVGGFLSHGSLLGRNFDALEDERISEVKNISTELRFRNSALFKNMFSYKSKSEEFELAKAIIVWYILLEIDVANISQPDRAELGYIAYEASRHSRYFEDLGPEYKITSLIKLADTSYSLENVVSDLLSVKRKCTKLLDHNSVQLAEDDIQQEFLQPAMRVAGYFLNYPGEMSEIIGMKK